MQTPYAVSVSEERILPACGEERGGGSDFGRHQGKKGYFNL